MKNSNIQHRSKAIRKAALWILAFGILTFLAGLWIGFCCTNLSEIADEKEKETINQDQLVAQNALLEKYAERWNEIYNLIGQMEGAKSTDIGKLTVEIDQKMRYLEDWANEIEQELVLMSIYTVDKKYKTQIIELIEYKNNIKPSGNSDENPCQALEQKINNARNILDGYKSLSLATIDVKNRHTELMVDAISTNSSNKSSVDAAKKALQLK